MTRYGKATNIDTITSLGSDDSKLQYEVHGDVMIIHDVIVARGQFDIDEVLRDKIQEYKQSAIYARILQIESKGTEVLNWPKRGSDITSMKCGSCGTIHDSTIQSKFSATKNMIVGAQLQCTKCTDKKRLRYTTATKSKIIKELIEAGVSWDGYYFGAASTHNFTCMKCEHEWQTIPSKITKAFRESGGKDNSCPKYQENGKYLQLGSLKARQDAMRTAVTSSEQEQARALYEERLKCEENLHTDEELRAKLEEFDYELRETVTKVRGDSLITMYSKKESMVSKFHVATEIMKMIDWQSSRQSITIRNIRSELEAAGVTFLENQYNAATPVNLRCVCGHEHTATIQSKLLLLRRHGSTSCLKCGSKRTHDDRLESVKNRFDMRYNLTIVDETFEMYDKKARFICNECDHEFEDVIRNLEAKTRQGTIPCPKCRKVAEQDPYIENKMNRLNTWRTLGIEVLSENYNGEHTPRYENGDLRKILFRNNNCGHEFYALPFNVGFDKYRMVCSTCGDAQRKVTNKYRGAVIRENKNPRDFEWNQYREDATNATNRLYDEKYQLLNPEGYLRGKNGVEGAYQIDHIVSVSYCFLHDIPIELCTHIDNLRMIPWEENLMKSDDLVDYDEIPIIMRHLINMDL